MTQSEVIHEHLLAGKTISQVEAMAVYGISRLSAAVNDLRNIGVGVDTIHKVDEQGKRYSAYRLRQKVSLGDKVVIRRNRRPHNVPKWLHTETTVGSVVGALVSPPPQSLCTVVKVQFEDKESGETFSRSLPYGDVRRVG